MEEYVGYGPGNRSPATVGSVGLHDSVTGRRRIAFTGSLNLWVRAFLKMKGEDREKIDAFAPEKVQRERGRWAVVCGDWVEALGDLT